MDNVNQTNPSQDSINISPPPIQSTQNEKSNNPMLIILIVVVIAIAVIGSLGFYLFGFNQTKTSPAQINQTELEKEESAMPPADQNIITSNDLATAVSNVKNLYGGDLPWNSLDNKKSFQYIPRELNGMVVSSGKISINVDENFSPITVLKLKTGESIPVKSSFITYYEIPETLYPQLGITDTFLNALPISIKLYEFGRDLTATEKEALNSDEFFSCYNEHAEPEISRVNDSGLAIKGCKLNLTKDQFSQVGDNFFDELYYFNFEDQNTILILSFDSKYIKDDGSYIEAFLTKLFSTNESLMVDSSMIESVEDAKEFHNWRVKTFE